jgi:hypothetical protein
MAFVLAREEVWRLRAYEPAPPPTHYAVLDAFLRFII